MNTCPTLAGYKEFIISVGFISPYLPVNSPYIEQSYCLSMAQVNKTFALVGGGIYALMIYNLATDILINITQDYNVAIASISWSANVATVVTAMANTFISGNSVLISSNVPAQYNSSLPLLTQITVIDSTHLTYPVTPNPGAIVQTGTVGFNLFNSLRKRWNIDSFVAGVIDSSHDESTGESIAVPDSLRQANISDLQNLKTPYGRLYLSYAQKYGRLWGMS